MSRIGLTYRARRATAAVVEALFTGEEGPPEPRQVAWMVQDLDHFLGRVGRRTRLFYRGLLVLTSLWAPLGVGRLPPLRRLDRARRLEALERLEGRRLGAGLVTALKSALSLFWFEQPEVAHALGLQGRGPPRRGPRPLPGPQGLPGPPSAEKPALAPKPAIAGGIR